MKWSDINDIAIALEEKYPEKDNLNLLFTDLYEWIINLKDFDDDKGLCNEKKLEAIQAAWIEEREDQ